jgi:sugar lactone lactonase YvrE
LTSTSNPHGNWIDTRDPKKHVLLIADRNNRRILRYNLDDTPIDTAEGQGQFCHFQQYKDLIVVPDLNARVHIMKGNAIVTTFGAPQEGKPNPNGLRTTENRNDFIAGQFVAPHGATFDKEGNIFVAEWVEIGRFTKLRRV